MNPKIFLLSALVTIAISAPAEARHHRAAQFTPDRPFIDIAAKPSYPSTSQEGYRRMRHVGRIHSERHRAYPHSRRIRLDSPVAPVGQLARNVAQILSHPAGCPSRLFCGCGVSVRVFGHPVRDLFLASNWRRFPSAMAASGMVAWRDGHVFFIEQTYGDGTVLAYDPNSGHHLTRLHRVSLRGFNVVNPSGSAVTEVSAYRRHVKHHRGLRYAER